MKRNRITALFVILMFALNIVAPAVYAGNISDITGHWAEEQINEMISQGVISGYPDGTFKPDGKITRAEFASLTVRGFNLSADGGRIFNDTADHWAKESIATANAYGIVNGYSDSDFGPDDLITREQMAVMIVRAAELIGSGKGKTFADSQNISHWAKESVAIAAENNIISGYPDNTFNPAGNATRAEAAVVLNRGMTLESVEKIDFPETIEKAGIYGPETGSETIAGNVTVKAKNTVLQNLIIKGDLIIAKEVGDGDVTLDNIRVEGKTHIRGGGKDSIYINGGEYKEIIVEKTATGSLRIVALDAKGPKITIAKDAKSDEIILSGRFKNITVNANDVKIITQENTKIDEIKVPNGLKGVNFELAEDSTVYEMVLDSKVDVKGKGTIKEASGEKAGGSTYRTAPDKIIINGKTGGGGGGGSSGSGGDGGSDDGGSGDSTPVTKVSDISVSKTSVTLAVYDTTTITATVTVTPDTAANRAVTWSSSAPGVATVDGNGKITAVAQGNAIITVTSVKDATKTATVNVTVAIDQEAADNADIAAAKAVIESASYTATQEEVADASAAKTKAEALVNALSLSGTTVEVIPGTFVAAVAGDAGTPAGTDGSYKFTVTINKGSGAEVVTDELTMTITATAYDSTDQDNADIAAAKSAIEGASYTATQAEVADESTAKTKAQALVDALGAALKGTTVVVVPGTFEAAVAGAEGTPTGTNGSFKFTVTINKGLGTEVETDEQTMTITATPDPSATYGATFTVKDIEGNSIKEAKIVIDDEDKETDTSGSATFELNSGTYTYTVEKAGYALKKGEFKVNNTATNIDVTLYAPIELRIGSSELRVIPDGVIDDTGGKLSYDYATNTLTMDNYEGTYIHQVDTGSDSSGIVVNILLKGENKLDGGNQPCLIFTGETKPLEPLSVIGEGKNSSLTLNTISEKAFKQTYRTDQSGNTHMSIENAAIDITVDTNTNTSDKVAKGSDGSIELKNNSKLTMDINNNGSGGAEGVGWSLKMYDTSTADIKVQASGGNAYGIHYGLHLNGFGDIAIETSGGTENTKQAVGYAPNINNLAIYTEEGSWKGSSYTAKVNTTKSKSIETSTDGKEILIELWGAPSFSDGSLQPQFTVQVNGEDVTNSHKKSSFFVKLELEEEIKQGDTVTVSYQVGRVIVTIGAGQYLLKYFESPVENTVGATYGITVAEVVGGTATVATDPTTGAGAGAKVTVNISDIEDGKEFKSITVTAANGDNVPTTIVTEGKKYTFTMPTKAVTVKVEVGDKSTAKKLNIGGTVVELSDEVISNDANGKLSYDEATNTLTMDNYTGTYIYGEDNIQGIKIKVIGKNKLESDGTDSTCLKFKGDVEIFGEGGDAKLELTAPGSTAGYQLINTDPSGNNNLIIDGVEVIISHKTAGNSGGAFGLFSSNVTLQNGAFLDIELECENTDNMRFAYGVNGKLILEGSSSAKIQVKNTSGGSTTGIKNLTLNGTGTVEIDTSGTSDTVKAVSGSVTASGYNRLGAPTSDYVRYTTAGTIEVEYTATGSIDEIPANVIYAGGKFTITQSDGIFITEFTFKDDDKEMKAMFEKGVWMFEKIS